MKRRSGGRGFTLVELLVVITIIGILIALLLPAVQAAREAARRAQCSNNLKQVALALLNYDSAFSSFPPAITVRGSENGIDGSVLRANWAVCVLPYLEQQPLFDSFDRDLPISDPANSEPRGASLSVMLCPSDLRTNQKSRCSQNGGNWGRGNYGANGGEGVPSDTTAWNDRFQRGVMGRNNAQRVEDIRDGTTNTFLLLEMRAGLHALDRRGTWAMGLASSSSLWRHGSNYVTRPNKCSFGDEDLIECSQLVSALGVDLMQRQCMGCFSQSGGSGAYQSVARSNHPGGIFVALCDGSVRFVSDYIESGAQTVGFDPDPAKVLTWQRLIASSDGMPIDASKW